MNKQCSICKKKKPLSDFYKQSKDKTYYRSECKKCSKAASRRYYNANRAEVLETARLRYQEKIKRAARRR
ncbi:MAG: hypothetical protein ACYTEL_22925 [Planctomycetota bacterium]|jgi:hypothetical protein